MTLIKHRGKVVDTETGEVYSRRVGYTRKRGYMAVYLETGVTQLTQRFVWEAANGPIPEGMQINHINGIKTDNRLANLECVTPSANRIHAIETGLAPIQKGAAHHAAKLTEDQVHAIRALFDSGMTATEIARRETYISRRQIALIGARKAWAHLPERKDAVA